MAKNACVYCGASAYGPGCPFSPNKIHFHPGDAKKCVYCGSIAHGPGCPFNPHSNVHIHGIEFNSMVNEVIDTGITMGYLMSMLSTPITEMSAYKLGLIDKTGKRVKSPETAEELTAYGPLEEYVLGIKQTLGPKLGLITKSIDVQLESAVSMEDYAKICEATLHLKDRFEEAGKIFSEAVTNAYQSGLSTAAIEKLIVDSILEPK